MRNIETAYREEHAQRSAVHAGLPVVMACEPTPVDVLDDFTLDLDADAAIAACEALWHR